jgi:hypothetical protein
MNKKWASLALIAGLAITAGCNKGDTSTNSTTDGSQPGSEQSASSSGAKGGSGAPRRDESRRLVVPEGTEIPVVLTSTISSKVARAGDEFEVSVASDIMAGSEVAIPKGTRASGTVVDAKKQGTFKGEADLAITLTRLEIKGKAYTIDTSNFAGTQKGKGKRTAAVTGGGAAIGALIGGLAGGGKGAAIGAGAGAGGGLAASGATGGKNVVFPAESNISFTLKNAVTIER